MTDNPSRCSESTPANAQVHPDARWGVCDESGELD